MVSFPRRRGVEYDQLEFKLRAGDGSDRLPSLTTLRVDCP
jgi:hypothetical protein